MRMRHARNVPIAVRHEHSASGVSRVLNRERAMLRVDCFGVADRRNLQCGQHNTSSARVAASVLHALRSSCARYSSQRLGLHIDAEDSSPNRTHTTRHAVGYPYRIPYEIETAKPCLALGHPLRQYPQRDFCRSQTWVVPFLSVAHQPC